VSSRISKYCVILGFNSDIFVTQACLLYFLLLRRAVRIYIYPAARIMFDNTLCVTEFRRGDTGLGCGMFILSPQAR
jgi:hypothetical protein